MEEMETDMLKDHDAIDRLLKARERERETMKEAPEIPETAGSGRMTAVIYKIAFPIISTALATVVRTVIEKAIGG